jgi:hypothetical protein
MPKIEIDYSNTIIYKIACKDPLITDVYVGHTTNFVQRKYAHKQACNNVKSQCYNLKLYKTIRSNGNWFNWDMTIIQFYNCKNHLEARHKEQEHFIALKATLNSIEQLPPKIVHVEPHSIQHNTIFSQKCQNQNYNVSCVMCDYVTCRKKDFNKHLLTKKHINNVQQCGYNANNIKLPNTLQIIPQAKLYSCVCGKIYMDNSGLWRHKKKCDQQSMCKIVEPKIVEKIESKIEEKIEPKIVEKIEPKIEEKPLEIFDKEMLIIQLLKQNQELQQSLIELAKNSINITNNNTNNSHNKTFNLQIFLNEECKDALNINEFVSSIKVELDDLEATGRLGYVEGVSRIMNKNLKKLDINKRPIHCSDLKREVLYIKNDDQWTKEEDTKPILKKAIKQVAFENIKKINEWKQKHPGCTNSDSRKNDLYLKIVGNAMSGLTTEEQIKNIDKIVSKVAKETIIDK